MNFARVFLAVGGPTAGAPTRGPRLCITRLTIFLKNRQGLASVSPRKKILRAAMVCRTQFMYGGDHRTRVLGVDVGVNPMA